MTPSPCINICAMNEENGYCKGCFRSIEEIAAWASFSEDKKVQILGIINLRKNA